MFASECGRPGLQRSTLPLSVHPGRSGRPWIELSKTINPPHITSVQYCGGFRYIGGCSVHWGDNISTVGDSFSTVHVGDSFSTVEVAQSVQWRITSVLWP